MTDQCRLYVGRAFHKTISSILERECASLITQNIDMQHQRHMGFLPRFAVCKYVLLLAYIDSNFVRLVLVLSINVEVPGEALKIYFLDFVSEVRNQPSELRVLFPLLIFARYAHTRCRALLISRKGYLDSGLFIAATAAANLNTMGTSNLGNRTSATSYMGPLLPERVSMPLQDSLRSLPVTSRACAPLESLTALMVRLGVVLYDRSLLETNVCKMILMQPVAA